MHLALAEEILQESDLPLAIRRRLIRQRGPFLLGHTAPDVQSVSGQRRDESHFYTIPRPPRLGRSPVGAYASTRHRPAYKALFAAHPSLARAESLPPAQAAFVAGYIAHLLLDELWLDDIFQRYFLLDWAPLRERLFLHNVLRIWMDRRDRRRLDSDVAMALREAEPRDWLPFVSDEHLLAWRDWLVEQLGPGQSMQTAAVFARRMGVSAAELEKVSRSPQQMEERIFRHVSRAALQSFHDTGYERSTTLIVQYLNGNLPN